MYKPRKKSGVVKTKIQGKSSITVNGKVYRWNSVYRVYNAVGNYSQLSYSDFK
jgi:hypothetical protein